jgi:hypothetical protein
MLPDRGPSPYAGGGVGSRTQERAMTWLSQDIADNLLGNARPRSFAKVQEDDWWKNVFDRWWYEASSGKTMYEAVYSLYNDLVSYYNGQMDVYSLHQEWVVDPPDVTLIDASAREAFATAHSNGDDPNDAIGRLWEATTAQLEMVYQNFYEDVGRAKDTLRKEGLDAALAEAFPTL